jgi:hypothetical protein
MFYVKHEGARMLRKKGRRPLLDLKAQKIIPSEFEECKAFWDYCQRVLRLGMTIYHIPNEGARAKWHTQALVGIGLTSGIPDYHFVPENGRYRGLWVEMKRVDGREKKKEVEQERCIAMLLALGHYACYAYGAVDAINILDSYVKNKL